MQDQIGIRILAFLLGRLNWKRQLRGKTNILSPYGRYVYTLGPTDT